MKTVDLNDLVRLLRVAAGEDESVDLDGDILDRDFEELGYDSLALFNTVGMIEREYGVILPEEVVGEARTPRALLDEIARSSG
ncbi:acyl carrier protein [Actinomadura kijaniata]|uniref:acyl carrier protein n=1 Tax=Actinomadura kijaniata TaxID=46161 RepID=UPI003F1B5887